MLKLSTGHVTYSWHSRGQRLLWSNLERVTSALCHLGKLVDLLWAVVLGPAAEWDESKASLKPDAASLKSFQ